MLLALSLLYFKLGQLDASLDYLKKLRKCNKDTKKFLRLVCRGDEEEIFPYGDDPYGYQPNTIEELVNAYADNLYLFVPAEHFFHWANRQIKN